MWIMKSADRAELERYRATGLTPDDVEQLACGVLPDDEDRAPLPWADHDPAQEAYEDAWDYPTPEQQKRYSGLLEDEA